MPDASMEFNPSSQARPVTETVLIPRTGIWNVAYSCLFFEG